ncbi:MAG TPA: hypothetical protein VLZ76_06450 [Lysobacter sp.]|nr:hypothetical protein [Lysobacter sp.]
MIVNRLIAFLAMLAISGCALRPHLAKESMVSFEEFLKCSPQTIEDAAKCGLHGRQAESELGTERTYVGVVSFGEFHLDAFAEEYSQLGVVQLWALMPKSSPRCLNRKELSPAAYKFFGDSVDVNFMHSRNYVGESEGLISADTRRRGDKEFILYSFHGGCIDRVYLRNGNRDKQ